MTIFNLGSINIDHFYRVPRLPTPGETLAATGYAFGLGGKGANQSAAAAKAGARTVHIGAVGPDGAWTVERLRAWGVETAQIVTLDVPTGHAVVQIDDRGENAIILCPSANRAIPLEHVTQALASAGAGDTLLLQNETDHQAVAARHAREKGLRVTYSAAPFDPDAVRAVLPFATLLVLNAVEAEQLSAALRTPLDALDVPEILITRGAQGAEWRQRGGARAFAPALSVTAVDTTGAGDTFAGYFAAGLDLGQAPEDALRWAATAAALKVTRPGTADAIPAAAEVAAFRV